MSLLNRHVDQAVLLEFTLGVEVGHKETSRLVGFTDLSHELNVQLLGKMLNVLLEIGEGRVDLHFVLPVVVSPLLLKLKLRTVSWHESIDEVDLNLVDVDDIWNVSTGRVECQVPVDSSIVSRADLE